MIADKQAKELGDLIKDLEGQILTGSLAHEDYKAKCAARKAYLRAAEIIKTISGDEEDDK